MWMTQGKVSHWSVFNCALDLTANMWIIGFLTMKCETGLQSIGLVEWLENCTYPVQFESHSCKGSELWIDENCTYPVQSESHSCKISELGCFSQATLGMVVVCFKGRYSCTCYGLLKCRYDWRYLHTCDFMFVVSIVFSSLPGWIRDVA
jgi:hypothetical protein